MANLWTYMIPAYGQYKMTEDMWNGFKRFVGSTARELITGKSDEQRAQEEAEASTAQQLALKHAEEREDTAVQRRVADLQAAGINPVLAGSAMGSADSSASQQAVYSNVQQQQAQAQQIQALSSLLSAAAMLFLTKGKGRLIPAGSAKHSTYITNAYYNRK